MISSGNVRRYSFTFALVLAVLFMAAVFTIYGATGTSHAEEIEAVDTGIEFPDETGRIPFPKPDTHRGDWIRYHGSYVDLNLVQIKKPDTGCYVCHDRNDCVDCHSTRPPKDHTNFWRTRSHGLEAGANRERCLRCHRQDYCVRCHNETAPRTHVGNWTDRHCTWCHYGSGLSPADNCVVCHRVVPHASAPHAVNPSVDCLVCHN